MKTKTIARISRQQAIDRVRYIHALALKRNYTTIENQTLELPGGIKTFCEKQIGIDVSDMESWDDCALVQMLEQGFYRWSMFEEYEIG